ncbi:MAG: purine-nucleoside phosphorylase [Desulfurococcaceae archaeon]
MTQPIHVKAQRGEIAKRVVIAGDPARVVLLSTLLDEARMVSDVRGYHVYTGLYRGVPITVAVHGIGSASAVLVLEELIMLGAKVVVRLGTCGAMIPELDIGDIVIPTGASYYSGGIFQQYLGEPVCQVAVPDYQLLENIVSEVRRINKRYVLAPVVSCDAFYTEPGFVEKWTSRGVVAVDMETAPLLAIGLIKKVKVASLLIVSNSLVKQTGFALAPELEVHVREVAPAVLRAITSVDVE